MRCIVFLGNPGREYDKTRHNVGRRLIDAVSFAKEVPWNSKFKGRFAPAPPPYAGTLLVPETYMNRSGESVGACLRFFKIDAADLTVVHDDIELPFGTIDVRIGGGLGGHNGLRSIVSAIGTQEFARLRIGISRPRHGDAASHVLGRFDPDEEPVLPLVLTAAARVVEDILRTGASEVARSNPRRVVVDEKPQK
ncbi:MAG: aminoacyl-tRNA hydrolase [Spirochaetaceae bacterium]|nr:MAG: aminoacyl-tRNA hydrolase [Spirochaetaceae bacterium]